MPGVKFVTVFQAKKLAALTVRAQRELLKGCYAAVGAEWHREMLPRHFEPGAGNRYKYQRRTRKTHRRKQRLAARGLVRKGGQADLVWSGTMERLLEQSAIVKAFPTRASVKMVGPRYMTMKAFTGDRGEAVRRGWKYGKLQTQLRANVGQQPDKAREVKSVTGEEKKQLARLFQRKLNEGLAGLKRAGQVQINQTIGG